MSSSLPQSICCTLLTLISLGLGCFGLDHQKSLEQRLQDKVKSQIYWLTRPFTSDKLDFDASGQVVGNSETGSPAMNGLVQITHLSLSGGALRVTGWRAVAVWSNLKHEFSVVVTDIPIQVAVAPTQPVTDETAAQALWGRVFTGGDPNKVLASFWQPSEDFASGVPAEKKATVVIGSIQGRPVYEKESVVPSKLGKIKTKGPEHYPQYGLKGLAKMEMIVDESGKISLLISDNPNDPLQADAIDSFARLTFSNPATRDGKAVAVLIKIEQEYH